MLRQRIDKESAKEILEQCLTDIHPHLEEKTQTSVSKMFKLLADLTGDDGALADIEELKEISILFDDTENLLPQNHSIDDIYLMLSHEPEFLSCIATRRKAWRHWHR